MQAGDCFGSLFRRQGRVIFGLTSGASRHLLVSSKGEAVPDEEFGRGFEEQVLSAYETLGCSPERRCPTRN